MISALDVFLKRYALYKSTFYLLTYLHTYLLSTMSQVSLADVTMYDSAVGQTTVTSHVSDLLLLLDPEGGSQKATIVVVLLLLVLGISSLRV